MTKAAIIYDDAYLDHDTGAHVESKERLEVIVESIRSHEKAKRVPILKPYKATFDQVRYNHDPTYIKSIQRIAESGGGWVDLDTYCSTKSYEVALLAVGGVICAVDAVLGDIENIFALVRPPGHHAAYNKAMGFCIFNNVACGTKYAQYVRGVERILIVDWDVHHGNGTQAAFYSDPRVLYFSTHQRPLFPGTGDFDEVGRNGGEGFNVNVPLSPGVNDDGFRYVFERILLPISTQFQPELIFISAGLDIHYADPIGSMCATANGFKMLSDFVTSLSLERQLIAVLEGGYDPIALKNSALSILGSLADFSVEVKENYNNTGVSRDVEERVRKAINIQAEYWEL